MSDITVVADDPTTVIVSGNVINIGGDTTYHLGAKSAAPTLDNAGLALQASAKYFNTTNNIEYVYTGSAWIPLNSIDGAIDSNIVSPVLGEALIYNSSNSKWENGAVSGLAELEAAADFTNLVNRKVLLGLGTWTESATGMQDARDITYSPELKLIVLAGYNTATLKGEIRTSSDGVTWTVRYTFTDNYRQAEGIAWSAQLNLFTAIYRTVNGNESAFMSSSDGITWTLLAINLLPTGEFTLPYVNQVRSMVWFPSIGKYFVPNPGGGAGYYGIYYSNNGTNWYKSADNNSGYKPHSIAYSPSLDIMIVSCLLQGGAQNFGVSTDKGSNFNYTTGLSTVRGTDGEWKVLWVDTLALFVAADLQGGNGGVNIYTSSDGYNWTASNGVAVVSGARDIVWSDDLKTLIMLPYADNQIYYSADAISWTAKNLDGSYPNQRDVHMGVWANHLGKFVLVTDGYQTILSG